MAKKVKETADLSREEIVQKVDELKKKLLEMRIASRLGKLEKVNTIRETRRDVARLLTALTQKNKAVVQVKKA